MNERIQQLAEQAHSYACKYAQQPDYNPHNPYNQGMYKQRYDSKFAELIVRECVRVMYDNAIERKVPPDIDKTPLQYAIAIKEHFGVEE
jgi:hypothetical protein